MYLRYVEVDLLTAKRAFGKAILGGVLSAVLLLSASAGVAETMYGSAGPFEVTGQTVPPGSLLMVDQCDGSGTLVGIPVPDVGLSGIAFDSAGQLFGSTRVSSGEEPGTLVRIDPESGSLLETLGIISDGVDNIGISDLAFQPGTDVLFGISSGGGDSPCSSCLYTIDTETALATLVGQPDVTKGGGLGFAPDGTFYLTTTFSHSGNTFDPLFELVSLNPADASVLSREDALLEVPQEARGLPILSVRFDGLGVRPTDGALLATQGGGALEIYQRVILADGPRWRLLGNSVASMADLDFGPVVEPSICGDVDDDGVLSFCDGVTLRFHLADPNGLPLSLAGQSKCTVIGEPRPCDILDVSVIRRTVEGPDLSPGVAPVCQAALRP